MFVRDFHCQVQEFLQLGVAVAHVHSCSGKHIGRPHQHRIAHFGNELVHPFHIREFAPARLVYAEFVHYGGELASVLGPVYV